MDVFESCVSKLLNMHFIKTLVCLFLAILIEVILAEYVYPDGGRNVIPVIKHKHFRPQPYNDGTVMAHVIGSAGMNFLYYFHILGVSCENTDPEFYKIIQKVFAFRFISVSQGHRLAKTTNCAILFIFRILSSV